MLNADRKTGNERFSTLPQFSLEVGGINGPRLLSELSRGRVYVYSWAGELLDSLQRAEKQEKVSTVKFKLRNIGIRDYVSGLEGWEKITKAVRKEGLDLLPQLTAPEMSIKNPDMIGDGEWVDFLSKPITDRFGDQNIFELRRIGGELKLGSDWTHIGWNPDDLTVARLR